MNLCGHGQVSVLYSGNDGHEFKEGNCDRIDNASLIYSPKYLAECSNAEKNESIVIRSMICLSLNFYHNKEMCISWKGDGANSKAKHLCSYTLAIVEEICMANSERLPQRNISPMQSSIFVVFMLHATWIENLKLSLTYAVCIQTKCLEREKLLKQHHPYESLPLHAPKHAENMLIPLSHIIRYLMSCYLPQHINNSGCEKKAFARLPRMYTNNSFSHTTLMWTSL